MWGGGGGGGHRQKCVELNKHTFITECHSACFSSPHVYRLLAVGNGVHGLQCMGNYHCTTSIAAILRTTCRQSLA